MERGHGMETSLLLIAIFTGVIALSNLILLGGLAYLAITASRLVGTEVKPVLADVRSTLRKVNETVDEVETKTEHIMGIGEDTARKVSGRVVATTDVIQDAIIAPLVNISSILTGISRAIETLRRSSVRT